MKFLGKRSFTLGFLMLVCFNGSLSARHQEQAAIPDLEAELASSLTGDGPFPAIIDVNPGLPNHVIYRPANLAAFAGGRLPVLAWGNGGCYDDGTAQRHYLSQIASYGYLVIAPGLWRSGPGATSEPLRPEPIIDGKDLPRPPTTAQDVLLGIDWALAETERTDSPFGGLIDRQALAVGGYSCGGLQAIELAADSRIAAVLINNSGIYDPKGRGITGIEVSKEMLADFHSPVLYLTGGPEDGAYPNGLDDFQRVDHVPIIFAELPVGHGGTFDEPFGGAMAHVAVDWLEWQLRDDKVAARTFLGENCRLCTGTDWSIRMKGF